MTSRTIPTLLLAILATLTISVSWSGNAEAKRLRTCGRANSAMLMKNADRVFLAKIGTTSSTAGRFSTEMKPLFAFKGEMTKTFSWSRPSEHPSEIPHYKQGELQIIFVKNGTLSRCLGNSQMDLITLPPLLKAGRKKTQKIETKHLQLALKTALKGYTHNRKKIVVHYSPLRGKGFDAFGSRFRVIASAKSINGRTGSIVVDQALQFANGKNSFAVIWGRYPIEGVRFRILLKNGDAGPEVIYENVAEQ